jgi:phenylpyruvate tautomerase PptA (4-oxalocrotonate tautomerase family)
VRVQVLTPVGVLDREKQLGVVKELTDIVSAAAGDPSLVARTWVLIVESPEGGWGIGGHAFLGPEIAQAARAEIAAGHGRVRSSSSRCRECSKDRRVVRRRLGASRCADS